MTDQLLPLIEGAWIVAALVGIATSTYGFRAAREDRRFAARVGARDVRWVVAQGAVRREELRLLMLIIFALLGVALLIQPRLVALGIPPALIRFGILLSFGISVAHITLVSILEQRDRRAVLSLLAHDERPALQAKKSRSEGR